MAADDAIKNHAAERRLFLIRAIAASLLLLILIGMLIARVVYLQVYKHGYYETRSQDNRMRVEVVPPVRGLIFDRQGDLLANNEPAYRLEIVPEQVSDNLKSTIARLSKIVDISDADKQRFYSREKQTPLVSRHADPAESDPERGRPFRGQPRPVPRAWISAPG